MREKLLFGLVLLCGWMGYSQSEWRHLSGFSQPNSMAWMSTGAGNFVYGITPDYQLLYRSPQAPSWQPFAQAPTAGNFGSIRATPDSQRVFCLTFGGIAYTDNLGVNWQHRVLNPTGSQTGNGAMVLGYGIYQNQVLGVTLGPTTGLPANRVYRSTDSGNTYTALGTVAFFPIAFYYAAAQTVYAPSSTGIFRCTNLTAFDWELVGFEGLTITDLEVQGEEIYAAVTLTEATDQVWYSPNAGQTWQQLAGLPAQCKVPKLAMDWNTNRLYAATSAGVYRYAQGEWNAISAVTKAHEMVVAPNGDAYFSGVRTGGVSRISATTQQVELFNEGLQLPSDLMQVANDGHIYTASLLSSYVSKYSIATEQWQTQELFPHLSDTRVVSMAKSPDGQVVIGGIHYLAKTTVAGGAIQLIADPNTAPLAPIYNQLVPQKLVVGNNGSLSMVQHSTQNYVDYSPNMGQNWAVFLGSGTNPGFFSIETVRTGTQTHYVWGVSSSTFQNQILSCTIGQNTWNAIALPPGNLLDIFIDKQDQLYAATRSNIYRWQAGSQSWVALNINIGQTVGDKKVELVFNAANNPVVLVRGTLTSFAEEGLYMPLNSGDGFTQHPFPMVNGQMLRLQKLGLVNDQIPIAMTLDNENLETNGLYFFHDSPDLSTTQPTETAINIYPNPTTDYLFINGWTDDRTTCQIVAVDGRSWELPMVHSTVDVRNLATGIYWIIGYKEGIRYTARFIKN